MKITTQDLYYVSQLYLKNSRDTFISKLVFNSKHIIEYSYRILSRSPKYMLLPTESLNTAGEIAFVRK